MTFRYSKLHNVELIEIRPLIVSSELPVFVKNENNILRHQIYGRKTLKSLDFKFDGIHLNEAKLDTTQNNINIGNIDVGAFSHLTLNITTIEESVKKFLILDSNFLNLHLIFRQEFFKI